MKRFRPRFTVRTLAIVVTLVCTYFGTWEATKKQIHEEQQFERAFWPGMSRNYNSPMPFVIRQVNSQTYYLSSFEPTEVRRDSEYYLWLCGPKIKLPFGSE